MLETMKAVSAEKRFSCLLVAKCKLSIKISKEKLLHINLFKV